MIYLTFKHAPRSWEEMLVSIHDYKQEPDLLFEGSFEQAFKWLRQNNYEYVAGTNGQYVKRVRPLTSLSIFAKINSLYKEFLRGSLARFSTYRRPFR